MKAKLCIIFSFAIIYTFLVSCAFSAVEKPEEIIINDMATSREGTLPNGKRFIFYGADQVSITLEQHLEETEYFYYVSYDYFIVEEETIEEMLERPELHLGVSHLPPDDVTIVVYYFSESNDVLFMVVPNYDDVAYLGFPSVTVVNSESGGATIYYIYP